MTQYANLKNTYENFFITYALNGSIANKNNGTRYGMPHLGPLKNSTVSQPSIINTKFQYLQSKRNNFNLSGVL
jgi:hypothetical protein